VVNLMGNHSQRHEIAPIPPYHKTLSIFHTKIFEIIRASVRPFGLALLF
jgi:hypothetical protein